MKRTIILIACMSGLAYGNQYKVFVNDENNDYKMLLADDLQDVRYTDWVSVSLENCVIENNWQPENVYMNTAYTKKTTCDDNQERYKEYYKDNVLIKREKETKIEESVVEETLVGLFEAKNCKEIIDTKGNKGDGNYILTVNGAEHSNYCDMNNGGWTLAMRLVNSGQFISGSMNRDDFWNQGSTMSGYITNTFTTMHKEETGFIGWNRLKSMSSSENLEIRIIGVNGLNENINENYQLNNFNPNMTNNRIETGNMHGGGVYTLSKRFDVDARNGWGTCGKNELSDSHIGFGLCTNGYSYENVKGRNVQVWNYGVGHGAAYSNFVNVSFGNASSGLTENYQKVSIFDFNMFIK